MKIKCIIFDFDGVIKDSVDIKTNAFAEIFSKYGTSIVNKVLDHHKMNGGISRFEKIKHYYKQYLKIDLTKPQIQEIANEFSEIVLNKVIDAPFIKGAEKYIKTNYKNYKMFISTGTPHNEIIQIVRKTKLNKYFKEVFGSPEQKIDHLNMISHKWNIEKQNMVFIGDALTDKNAANIFNIKFIARANKGDVFFNDEKYKINDLSQLQEIISTINNEAD